MNDHAFARMLPPLRLNRLIPVQQESERNRQIIISRELENPAAMARSSLVLLALALCVGFVVASDDPTVGLKGVSDLSERWGDGSGARKRGRG